MQFIKTAFFVLIPSLAGFIILWLGGIVGKYVYISMAAIAAPLYLLTVAYIIALIAKKHKNMALLPVSFMLTPAAMFIYESLQPGKFSYLGTYLAAIFYALPFTIITLIAVFVVFAVKRRAAV